LNSKLRTFDGDWQMDKRVLIGVGVGCAVLCCLIAVVALAAGGVLVKWMLQEPENVNINTNIPIQVEEGETVTLVIEIENLAAESQSLDSIDISHSYLAGIVIAKADPPFSESYPIPLLDMESFTFAHPIPAGETLVVEFAGWAEQVGDFAGEMDVCINSSAVCSTFTLRTVVGGE